jgi:hypothetical protein
MRDAGRELRPDRSVSSRCSGDGLRHTCDPWFCNERAGESPRTSIELSPKVTCNMIDASSKQQCEAIVDLRLA